MQAIDRVVGDGDRLFVIRVGNDRQHRPEDLLARDGHVIADVGEQRRPHKPAVEPARPTLAAGKQRALVDTDTDISLNAIPLLLADHRADRR